MFSLKNLITLLFSVSLVFIGKPSNASLGGLESSADKDRVALSGTRKMIPFGSYRIQEITDHQQIVREYVGKNGVVFAVTWRGSGQPDLSLLFGSYYSEYQQAELSSVRPIGRGPRRILSKDIVAEKSGHMGDIRGVAYVPSLVPSDFNLQELR